MANEPDVECFHDKATGTWQYVVSDPVNAEAAIIDPVLDFDSSTLEIRTQNADDVLEFVSKKRLHISWILETHAHADHLSAAKYLKNQLLTRQLQQIAPVIGIGGRIHMVQTEWTRRLSLGSDVASLNNSFEKLFVDDEEFLIGGIKVKVLHLPGHTPDHIGYLIGSNVFTGDSIFNPDLGTARCDFPGGDARDLWNSTRKLLSLPDETRLYTGHDYPPATREAMESGQRARPFATVAEHRASNSKQDRRITHPSLREQLMAKNFSEHVNDTMSMNEFVKLRTERDATLSNPKNLFYAIQANIRGGNLPDRNAEGERFFKVPIKQAPVF